MLKGVVLDFAGEHHLSTDDAQLNLTSSSTISSRIGILACRLHFTPDSYRSPDN